MVCPHRHKHWHQSAMKQTQRSRSEIVGMLGVAVRRRGAHRFGMLGVAVRRARGLTGLAVAIDGFVVAAKVVQVYIRHQPINHTLEKNVLTRPAAGPKSKMGSRKPKPQSYCRR